MCCHSNGVSVTVWRDTKLVYVMSSNTSSMSTTNARRKAQDGSTRDVPCPESVMLYNAHMGGVDRADQLRGYYPIRMKCRKFYKWVWAHCFIPVHVHVCMRTCVHVCMRTCV